MFRNLNIRILIKKQPIGTSSLKKYNKKLKYCECKQKLLTVNDNDCFCKVDRTHISNTILHDNKIYCDFDEKYIKKYKLCNCEYKCEASLSELELYNIS